WLDPVTTVIWPNKSRTEYNQADLLSTKFHADMRDSGEDLRWQNQINIVENNYNNKPINNVSAPGVVNANVRVICLLLFQLG
ncbi:hypothetical protein SARC_17839, partial [Sphaeroforma arctica JP610]